MGAEAAAGGRRAGWCQGQRPAWGWLRVQLPDSLRPALSHPPRPGELGRSHGWGLPAPTGTPGPPAEPGGAPNCPQPSAPGRPADRKSSTWRASQAHLGANPERTRPFPVTGSHMVPDAGRHRAAPGERLRPPPHPHAPREGAGKQKQKHSQQVWESWTGATACWSEQGPCGIAGEAPGVTQILSMRTEGGGPRCQAACPV